jgi:hypothetical protein
MANGPVSSSSCVVIVVELCVNAVPTSEKFLPSANRCTDFFCFTGLVPVFVSIVFATTRSLSDESCNVLVMRTTTADAAGIEASEAAAELLFTNETTFLHIESDDTTTIIVPEKVHHLEFDKTKTSHTFTINGITENAKHQANYVIYSQHMMSEFEGDSHFLKDSAGKDIEPKASEPEHKAHGNSASSVVVSAMAATVVMVATILL